MAFLNAAVFVSSDEPLATASMVNSPDASGSGNARTPLSRMHSENFIPFSRAVFARRPCRSRKVRSNHSPR